MFIKQNKANDEKSKNSCDFDKNLEFLNETNFNYNNHYHLGEKNPSSINIMSGIKSLVCDFNGIIIAEMVYRCMICDVIYETIPEVQIHYQTKHIDQDFQSTSSHMNHTNCLANTSLSPNPKSMTTSLSFFGSLQSTTDSNWMDNDSSTPQTLTFDVPSGLKTLQQQFESTTKDVQPKRRGNKPFTTGNPKTKSNFNNKARVLGQTSSPTIKSGFITCEICGATKFYKYTQRRFGVYSCVGCAKFYTKYLVKPVHYMCENLGKCNLKVSECEPNGRCKACLIHKCKSKFIIDSKKLTNYSKMSSFLPQNDSKKTSNENKTKISTKPVNTKETNRNIKPKTLIPTTAESKAKTFNSPKTKTEAEVSTLNKTTSLSSHRKLKSDKTVRNINEKNENQTKKTGNTGPVTKTSVSKLSIARKMTRKTVNSGDKSREKRTRSQSCHKCFGIKGIKGCAKCNKSMESRKITEKAKMCQKLLKKRYCLTRSRNK